MSNVVDAKFNCFTNCIHSILYAVNMVLMCTIGTNTNILVGQCALMPKVFGKNQGLRLLEHVH